MPYDEVPATNAAAVPVQADEYSFTFTLDGTLPDGTPRSTIDDLDLFSAENNTSNKQMLDFLDRVVTKTVLRGERLIGRRTVKETHQDNGKTEERERVEEFPEGVRYRKIPLTCLLRLMEGVGTAMREANNPKN